MSRSAPTGKRIVSGSWDSTLRIWDADTGHQPLTGHTGAVYGVAFSPDGHAHRLRQRRPHHTDMGRRHRPADRRTPDRPHRPVDSVAFSPDGKRIVSGSWDGTLRIWDADTGQPLGAPLTGHTDAVYGVAFSPDGTRIVSGSADHTVRIWDADTGQPIGAPLTGHTDFVDGVAFSPDGHRIVSGSGDNTLRIWDADTGQPIGAPLTGHTELGVQCGVQPRRASASSPAAATKPYGYGMPTPANPSAHP